MLSRNNLIYLLLCLLIGGCNLQDKPTIVIPEGKVGMIGFGSLMSISRTEEVFGHTYEDSIYLVHLEGFQRSWDYVTSNFDSQVYTEDDLKYDRFYIQDNDTLAFDHTIYLNISESKKESMNCVLYTVTEKEINDMDLYEFGYERIDVTNKISEYQIEGGKVFAYKALPNYTYDSQKTIGKAIIEKDYFDLVANACDSIGLQFREEYENSTSPSNLELVALVIWKKVR
ncbi:MAG: hypothetical protein ABJH98_05910 [Reichenbachiella sp.]|uniref:hypothetical protein n=1 Tax=Reichenbachiella sp. TaxID=2184521 RepID=UPI0032984C22